MNFSEHPTCELQGVSLPRAARHTAIRGGHRSLLPPPPLLNLRLRVVGLAQIKLSLPARLVIAEVPVRPALGAAPALALVGPHLQLQPAVPVRPRLDHPRRRR